MRSWSFSTGSLSLSTGSRCDDETDAWLSCLSPQEKAGPGQQVQFSSTASTLQLQSSTVDNIYQMESDGDGGDGGDGGSSDGGGGDGGRGEDGGDYEYCP